MEPMPKTMTFKEKLLEVQKEIEPIAKAKDNPFHKSKYADISAILASVRPIFSKYRLILLQPTFVENEKQYVRTMIIDADSDEYREATLEIPTAQKAQEIGSFITYYRRYTLMSLFALEAEDDDGNLASGLKVTQGTMAQKKEFPPASKPVTSEKSPF